ncbi:MAG: hypothetical protein ACREC0_14480 [Methylocella sp.]
MTLARRAARQPPSRRFARHAGGGPAQARVDKVAVVEADPAALAGAGAGFRLIATR